MRGDFSITSKLGLAAPLLFHLAIPTWATLTRTAGLGLNRETSWMFSALYPQIYLNPAYASTEKSRFVADFHNLAGDLAAQGALYLAWGKHTVGLLLGERASEVIWNTPEHPLSFFYTANTATQYVPDNRFIDPAHYLRINTAIVNSAGLALSDSATIFEPNYNPLTTKNAELIYTWSLGEFIVGAKAGLAHSHLQKERKTKLLSEDINLLKMQIPFSAGILWESKRPFLRSFDVAYHYDRYILANRYDEKDLQGRQVLAELRDRGAYDQKIQAKVSLAFLQNHLFHVRVQYGWSNTSTTARAKSEINTLCTVFTDCYFDLEDSYQRLGQQFSLGFSDEIRHDKNFVWFFGLLWQREEIHNSFDGYNYHTHTKREDATPYGNKAPVMQSFSLNELPIFLGLEGKIHEKISIRFGLNHALINRRKNLSGLAAYREKTISQRRSAGGYVYQTMEIERKGQAGVLSQAALGLSILPTENFSLDWLLNYAMLTQGPHALSGKMLEFSFAVGLTYIFADEI
ncbi:MAG: hyaluronidase [Leptospiraceae bacterium]|nr:hyaluronidase [Leptospiraceae bacterium]